MKEYNDTIRLGCTKKSVCVGFDEYAIPYISAQTDYDAWFTLGFLQGKNRTFQLEYYKRQANGELAEAFGEKFIPADKLMRTIGLSRIAKKYLSHLDDDVYEMLNAFSNGINYGIDYRDQYPENEFEILNFAPSKYSIADVLSIQLFLAFSLTHWLGKLTRFLILQKESAEVVNKLDPPFAAWNYLIKPVGEKAEVDDGELYRELVEVKKTLNKKGASNNWCVSADRSTSGFPIVANDPHLGADIPAPWYFANVKGETFHICGACYPGSPVFFSGHNGSVAWSMTAAFIDNVDLYLEKLDERGSATLTDGKYIPCDVLEEEIRVKGKDPIELKILETKHGPLLNSAFSFSDDPLLSFCASWATPKPIRGFFCIQHCKDVKEVKKEFEYWSLTSTNLVMSDVQGNICWQLCGEIPIRRKTKGMLPMPGWDSAYDWEFDPLPFSENPYILNPEERFIATANNRHSKVKDEPYTGRDFIDGYRHARIINLLKTKQKWSVSDFITMQQDQYSTVWEQIRGKVLAISPQNHAVEEALQILGDWDGFMRSDSTATLIHEFFIAELTPKIIREIAPGSVTMIYDTYNPAIGSACFAMSRISQIVQFINDQPGDMFEGNWQKLLHDALEVAMQKIMEDLGTDVSHWQWGTYRPLVLRHPLVRNLDDFRAEECCKRWNLGPIPWGGNEQTLSVAAGSILNPKIAPDFIPNLRSVIEVGNWDCNNFALAGGQSENPYSPHYHDLFDEWKNGKGITIAWSKSKVAEMVKENLLIRSNNHTLKEMIDD